MRFQEKAALAGQQPLFLPDSKWVAPELPSLRDRGIKRLSVDVETKDPDLATMGPGVRRGAKIVGLAVGTDDGHRWYLPVGHQGGGNLDAGVVRDWAKDELNAARVEVVGTNLTYDMDFLAEWDVTFKRATAFHDVQIAEPLLDEWRDEYNLDALSRDYLGEGKDETLLKEAGAAFGFTTAKAIKQNLWRLPANLAGPYAEGDVDRPLRIFELQEKKIAAEGLDEVYTVERKLIPILVAMRRRGVPVNMKKVERLRARFVAERDRWVAELKRLAGPRAELMEAASLVDALRSRGIDVPLTAKTGVPSVTKILLERYQRDELVRVILNGRKFNTLINTFLDSQIAGHQINGRVHPTFKQGRDDEGGSLSRFAGSNPNLQFIPARESDWQEDQHIAPLIRGIFEPEKGELWQRDDFSQIEYRLLVHFAVGRGADDARALYNANPKTDYHKFVAEMLGVDPEDKIKRKRVKNTNFAKGYGAQAPKLADTFGCSVAEAEEFVREYEEKLPFAKDTFDAAAKWAKKRGFVVTVLNRKQRFPFWGPGNYQRKIPGRVFRSREEAVKFYLHPNADGTHNLYRKQQVRSVDRVNTYMALNRKLQGSSADITKKSMVDGWEAGICDVIGPYKITVHDELGSSIPKTKRGDEAGRELVRIMEQAVTLRVPVLVESERGKDWGECG